MWGRQPSSPPCAPQFLPTPLAPQTFRLAIPEVQVQYSAHQLLEEGRGVSAVPSRSPRNQLWVVHCCNLQLEHCHPLTPSQVEEMRPAVLGGGGAVIGAVKKSLRHLPIGTGAQEMGESLGTSLPFLGAEGQSCTFTAGRESSVGPGGGGSCS